MKPSNYRHSRAQFSSSLRQKFCLLCSIQLFPKVSSEIQNSSFPFFTLLPPHPTPPPHLPPHLPAAAHPPPHPLPSALLQPPLHLALQHPGLSPAMLQTPGAVITSATCFATYCAEVLYRNLRAPGLSRWFSSCVALSPVGKHPLAVQAAVLYSCLAILLNLLPLKLCLYPAVLTLLAPLLLCPPTTRPVGGAACSSWSGSTDPATRSDCQGTCCIKMLFMRSWGAEGAL